MKTNQAIRLRAAVILIEDRRMLLMHHQKGEKRYWVLPGGGVEFGETIEQAGRRELIEETGIEVQLSRLLFISESIPPDQHRHVVNFYFQGTRIGGAETLGVEPGLIGMQWHQLEDLPHLLIYPHVTHELLEAVNGGEIVGKSIGNRWE